MVLIESLTEDGYLADPLEEIAATLAPDQGTAEQRAEHRAELLARLQCALQWLQSMEPTGVGARDLTECLCLQLRALPRSEAQVIAMLDLQAPPRAAGAARPEAPDGRHRRRRGIAASRRRR